MAASPRPSANRCRCWSSRRAIRAASPTCRPTSTRRSRWRMSPSTPSRSPTAKEIVNIMRRAFSLLRNGRGSPVIVELPADAYAEDAPDPLDYEPVVATKYGPDPAAVREAAKVLMAAKRPVIYAGQGVHWAEAYAELQGARRAAGHPGLHQPRGQELLRRDPSAGAGLGRPRLSRRRCAIPRPVRRHPRHRLLVHRDQLRHLDAEGQDDHPRHARSRRISTRTCRASTAWSATPS